MISTVDLTAHQLEQLDALLADTTTGASLYRPPVARDGEVLQDLECAGLARWTDLGYEITDAGRAVVVGRAQDVAASQAFVMYAPDEDLRESIVALKLEAARYLDGDGNSDLRERALADIEACQDELDRRAEAGTKVESPVESSGRHHAVPADDRPTETIDRVELSPTEPMPIAGTLPGVPTPYYPRLDEAAAERMLAAIKGSDTGEELLAGEWETLATDLGDGRGWLRRNLTASRVLVLSVLATVVVTWGVAWLVMG